MKYALGAVLLLTVLAYHPLRHVGVVYEDAVIIESVDKTIGGFPNRWLTMATFRWTGVEPRTAHGVTLALHLLNGWLVYRLVRRFWTRAPALAVATVFLWHPLATEAVIAFNGRSDVLMTTGWLVVALGLTRAGWSGVVVTSVGLLVSCLSKELGVAVVGLVAAQVPRSRTTLAVAALSVQGLILTAWPSIQAWWGITRHVEHGAFLWAQLQAVTQLAGLTVIPLGLSLDHDPSVVSAARVCLLLSGVALLGAWALWTRGLVAVAVLWIAVTVGPRFVIFGVETIKEHQIYPALVGVSVLVVLSAIRVADALQGYADFSQYRPVSGWTDLERDSCGTS